MPTGKRPPLRVDYLSHSIFRAESGAAYLCFGEYYKNADADNTIAGSPWRPGMRSVAVNITDPDTRELFIKYFKSLAAFTSQALKEYPADASQRAADGGDTPMAQWIADRKNGPVTTTRPAPKPVASPEDDLLAKLA